MTGQLLHGEEEDEGGDLAARQLVRDPVTVRIVGVGAGADEIRIGITAVIREQVSALDAELNLKGLGNKVPYRLEGPLPAEGPDNEIGMDILDLRGVDAPIGHHAQDAEVHSLCGQRAGDLAAFPSRLVPEPLTNRLQLGGHLLGEGLRLKRQYDGRRCEFRTCELAGKT